MMTDLDFLLGTEDIVGVRLRDEGIKYSLDIKFRWEMDCGCFSYNKESNLIIYFPNTLFEEIKNDLLKGTGKIYKYIINHKEYTGELLDFRVESYKEDL